MSLVVTAGAVWTDIILTMPQDRANRNILYAALSLFLGQGHLRDNVWHELVFKHRHFILQA